MSSDGSNNRLCNITTIWSMVLNSHAAEPEVAQVAQQRLLQRYGGAIKRYLLKVLGDEEAADELCHELALRFLRGDFRNVNPAEGRFRGYLKTVLINVVRRHRKKQHQQRFESMTPEVKEPAVDESVVLAEDRDFLDSWRNELLARCWAALSRDEEGGGQPYFTTLQLRAGHPDMPSPQLAALIGTRLGRSVTAVGVRQMLHRARQTFADLLIDEVANSLADPTDEQLEQELMVLGLFEHCRAALERREKQS
jgi:RNA polymerase sigma-70 factor (ECF subfamily)